MSETLSTPERRKPNELQEAALRDRCQRYEVEYDPDHYIVRPDDSPMAPGYAEGWLGGPRHANPEYATPVEPAGRPTLYIGVSPEGECHS